MPHMPGPDYYPETFNVPVETTNPITNKPLVAHIGIMFKPIQIGTEFGFAPEIIYFKNAVTGQGYTREEARVIITPELLMRAVESLKWIAWADPDIDPESKNLIELAAGEFGKE